MAVSSQPWSNPCFCTSVADGMPGMAVLAVLAVPNG